MMAIPGIAALLSPLDVLLDVEAHNRATLFARVVQRLAMHHALDREVATAALLAREALGSTGIGHGVAIPHARTAGLRAPIAAYARPRSAIDCEAPDGKPVTEFFFLFIPPRAEMQHLEHLAQVAQALSDPRFREALRLRTTPVGIWGLFAGGLA